jgi:hypothetical protein
VQFDSEPPSSLLARENNANKTARVRVHAHTRMCVSSRRPNYLSRIAWLVPSVALSNVSEVSGVSFPIGDRRVPVRSSEY